MKDTEVYVPPDPERRWSTERKEYLRAHYQDNVPVRDIMAVLNGMIGLPISNRQASAYAGRIFKLKRPEAMVSVFRDKALAAMKARRRAEMEARLAGDETPEAAERRRLELSRQAKARQQKAMRKAERDAQKKAEAKPPAQVQQEERARIAEKRNRLTELFMADQQRLDILRMERERRDAELAASKPAARPQRQRDPAVPSAPFSMSVMKMPDPRLDAYQEQRSAASRGRVADSYVAPLTRTLPE